MTSGNVSDEPIAFRDDDALARLAGIADLLLLHDRPIETRTDDSVARVVRVGARAPAAAAAPLARLRPGGAAAARARRAPGARLRGRAQEHVLPGPRRARVGRSTTSATSTNAETLRSFEEGIAHVGPAVRRRAGGGRPRPAPGLPLDRPRAGARGRGARRRPAPPRAPGRLPRRARRAAAPRWARSSTAPASGSTARCGAASCWSAGSPASSGPATCCRCACPGGEQAVRQPWRMACAWLAAATGEEEPALPPDAGGRVDPARWRRRRAAGAERASPRRSTTSAGRLCDAVAALCGPARRGPLRGAGGDRAGGRAADPRERGAYPVGPRRRPARARPARRRSARVLADVEAGVAAAVVAARFHAALAAATAAACAEIARRRGLDTAVLSGGVFQNRLLLEGTAAALEAAGLRVLVPERLPPNDGGHRLRPGRRRRGAWALSRGSRLRRVYRPGIDHSTS